MARIRITIDTDEPYKRAFLSRASIEGLTPGELFEKLVSGYCPEDLKRAEELVSEAEDDPPLGTKPKGKKDR